MTDDTRPVTTKELAEGVVASAGLTPLTPGRAGALEEIRTVDLRERGGSHASHASIAAGDGTLAEVRYGDWLDQQWFPPLRYAIPGLVPEGLSLVVGPPKIGKSWLLLDCLLAVAAGGTALGRLPVSAPARVLYLALEDSHRRMQRRARELLGDGESIPAGFAYLTRVGPFALLHTITEFMAAHPDTNLIAIDTLGKILPTASSGETIYQRDYRFGAALKELTDDHGGLAVVAAHHDRKAAAEDFVDSVSGTHGLAGAADAVMVLQRPRHSSDAVLQVTGRDIPERSYALQRTGIGAWQLDGRDLEEAAERVSTRAQERRQAERWGDRAREILSFVRMGATEGRTRAEITEKFGDVDQTLGRLVAADPPELVRKGRGVYLAVEFAQEA